MAKRESPIDTCKLLLDWKVEVPDLDDELRDYLKDNEVIRGESFQFACTFENIGKTDFPGGYVDLFEFEFPSRAVRKYPVGAEEWPIAEIPAGQTTEEKKRWFRLDADGVVWARLWIVPKEGKVLHYVHRKMPPKEDHFRGMVLFVVNREQTEIIGLLRRLRQQRDK